MGLVVETPTRYRLPQLAEVASMVALALSLSACSSGLTSEDVDQAVAEAVAANEAQRQTEIAALEAELSASRDELEAALSELDEIEAAAAAAPNVYEVVIGHIPDEYVEGDDTYASVSLRSFSGAAYLDALGEALLELGFPSATIARVENTRALDGTQTAEGKRVRASWTYHPDNGLQMVIEQTPAN